jgi:hypothetical protein
MVDVAATLPFEALRDRGDIGWAALDASRKGRPDGERWIIHGSAEFSERWLEREPAEVGIHLASAFSKLGGSTASVVAVHRWRYALVQKSLQRDFLGDATRGLLLAGDYCLGARVEAAWLSGSAAAGAVLRHAVSVAGCAR